MHPRMQHWHIHALCFSHKTGSVFPSFNLPPAGAKASSPGTAGKYRQVCVWAFVCVSSGRQRERKKKNVGNGRGGGDWWGPAWLSSFSHTALTKTSLFSWPVTQGRRPHDSPVPISRVTPQLQRREKLQSPAFFVYFCLSAPGAPHINPLCAWVLARTGSGFSQGLLPSDAFSLFQKTTFPPHFFVRLFNVSLLCTTAVNKDKSGNKNEPMISAWFMNPQSSVRRCITEWWHFNYHLLKASCVLQLLSRKRVNGGRIFPHLECQQHSFLLYEVIDFQWSPLLCHPQNFANLLLMHICLETYRASDYNITEKHENISKVQ